MEKFKHSSLFSPRKLDNYRKELLDKINLFPTLNLLIENHSKPNK